MRVGWTIVSSLVLAAAVTGCTAGVEGPEPVQGGAPVDEMYPTSELGWDDSAGIHNGKNPSEAAALVGAFLPRTHTGQPPENRFLTWDSMRVTVVGEAIPQGHDPTFPIMPSDEDLRQWAQQYEGMNYRIQVGKCGDCPADTDDVVHRRVAVTHIGRVEETTPMFAMGRPAS